MLHAVLSLDKHDRFEHCCAGIEDVNLRWEGMESVCPGVSINGRGLTKSIKMFFVFYFPYCLYCKTKGSSQIYDLRVIIVHLKLNRIRNSRV